MENMAKLFLVFCAVLYTISVIQLLIKRKINEKNTIHWLGAAFIVLLLASVPELLDKGAAFLGIDYPPSLLFLSTSLVLLYITLRQAVQLSELDGKVRELSQLIAIYKQQEIKEMQENAKLD